MTAQEIIAILQDASRAIYMTESWAIRKDKLFQLVETRERVNDAIVALQKQSKPKMSEGLEEEIDRVVEIFNQDYVEDGKGIQYGELNIFSDLRDIARHFAKWQKEQMMKEAVEGILFEYRGILMAKATVPHPERFKPEDVDVKLIVIKEDTK